MASKSSRAKRRIYSSEFKSEAAKLVLEQGLTQADAARDLGVAESLISRWVRDARSAAGPGALNDAERTELKRLRKENSVLRKERDILKKAAAFFARETL